ncbi:type 1 glutamine amidotransferase domain-containing protein [Paenisporosarcina cavernae]|uniref:Type 1 glutamine amidotransferase domain-containing protein n=1 Tax=Paenisporosarcina cavernae TaxID=2320858 RepID=A0A385YS24_9BACL|nr:type 1 glutamine amidotransferase domain-containing protein [Paenisporosarcina cavernae]AYC28522.1 type 1 glutamine amidotransferase domain-containing protein [Paenisporosarcina cavernae]
MSKKVLMVLTNHKELPNGKTTGVWLSEFGEAYLAFQKKGYDVTIASPNGGKIPVDPASLEGEVSDEMLATEKYLSDTKPVEEVASSTFDGVFLPGGHGTMFDLPGNTTLQDIIRSTYEADKPVAAVCHGPAGLVDVKLSNGKYLVDGKKVSAFTNKEEQDTGLQDDMPFLLESKLKEQGAQHDPASNWSSHVVTDGYLVTGQNPQSTEAVAEAFINVLEK